MKKIFFVVGARPQFIKAAPILTEMRRYPVATKLIHTGQHYDHNLSDVFFDELEIPTPDFNLNCGSGTSVEQYLNVLSRLTEILIQEMPNLIVVFGDTNSTGASALCAALHQIPIAHVEAGLREFDKFIPEETNKLVADSLADIFFCPTQSAVNNLNQSNVSGHIVLSGDPSLDLLFARQGKFDIPDLNHFPAAHPGQYFLATCHRQANTNDRQSLENILRAFTQLPFPVIFPIHPRTQKAVEDFSLHSYLSHPNICVVPPIGFWETQSLLAHCNKVLTDSGGLIKEAYFHGKYSLILDRQTEWVEVIEEGRGVICGPDYDRIILHIDDIISSPAKNTSLGSGNSSQIIAQQLFNSLY
ncbi:MAG: UDP-N-acetylglucosamine 2-epimerase (non-hydrolyzing) [Saprospiraceae bacterium]|nr:UDP-N-acetylglucosamine 2-epimerase (non-hydrolyzing) [Saprospiraceae bacterium]